MAGVRTVHQGLLEILDRTGVCVLVAAGENGRLVSANPSALRFLGMDMDSVSGEPVEALLSDHYRDGLRVTRDLVEDGGVVYQILSFRAGTAGTADAGSDLKRVFEDLDDVYFRTTIEGRIVSITPSVKDLTGFEATELIGSAIPDLYQNPADREKLLSDLVETGRVREYELAFVGKNGNPVHVRGSIHFVYDRHGNPEFLEGLLTDITKRKLLEKQVLSNSAFFSQVVESVPDAVVTVDTKGIVTGWNAEAVKLFGWTLEEAIGRPLDDLVWTDTGKNLIASSDIINGEVIRGLACTRRGKSPVEIKVFVSVAPIILDGAGIGAVGVYTDLSDRETILEKLRENEIRFRTITESAQDAVIIMDDMGYVSFFNSAAERMFGYHRSETAGRKLHDIISPEAYRDLFETGFREFRKTGQGIVLGRVVEMEGMRKDGTIFPVELSVSAFQLNEGWHATGILRDITERKRTELELIEAREEAINAARTKTEFLANMSHEIRTPLNAIIGTTDLLWETEIDTRQRDYLRVCREAGENLLKLIDDILDISKVEAGRVELERIPFDIRETLERVCETLALRAHAKGLELICNVRRDTPGRVIGDPSRITQVLSNLIGNAIKFTEHGEVAVEAGPGQNDELAFSVRDTGIGIPVGKLESIFISFTQADTSHTRRYGGTGLGLTICRKLVELMNGSISVESRLGEGSVFTFSCPLPMAADTDHGEGDETLPIIRGHRVLVVDDNSSSLAALAEMLEECGVSVRTACCGSKALDAADEARFDHILLDMDMPDMNGIDTALALKSIGQRADSIVMMLQTHDRGELAMKCRQNGISRFLVKPVRRSDLRARLSGAEPERSGEGSTPSLSVEKKLACETARISVLLAEDSPDNRFLIARYLDNLPWKLSVAENGMEALDLFRKERFDVILMDMQMPLMDGYEATRAIRAAENTAGTGHAPIIALTAHAMREEAERCIEAGCDIHVSKPVKKRHLLSEIDRLLSAMGPKAGPPDIPVSNQGEEARVPKDLEPLIPGYLDNRRRDIAAIEEHLSKGDFDPVRILAHSMKGSGGGYGFNDISRIGGEMEVAAKAADGNMVAARLGELRDYVATVKIVYVDEE